MVTIGSVKQCHRVVVAIASALERKQNYSRAFLDETHAFDHVWQPGLLFD